MLSRQTFGWTQLEQPEQGKYVKFVMTEVRDDGTFVLAMRDDDCRYTSMVLPPEARKALAEALLKD